MLPPPPHAPPNRSHDDFDSNRGRVRQRRSFANGINPPNTLANVATAPNAKAIAEKLRDAFLERARQDFPDGLERGWQRELERRTAKLPGIALRQSMISNVATAKVKAYRLDSLVRLRNYIGRPLDELLGLPPIAARPAEAGLTDEHVERLVERVLARRQRSEDLTGVLPKVRKRG